MRRATMLALLLLALAPRHATTAACSGSSPTWTAASPSIADINACITAATSGDTINVPAGSVTWNATLTLPRTKVVNIIGASMRSAGTTQITDGKVDFGQDGDTCPQAPSRWGGFTMIKTSNNYVVQFYCAQGWRFDHNIVTYSDASDAIAAWGYAGSNGEVTGLIDHNTFTYARFLYYGQVDSGKGNQRWFESLNWGTSHYIYLEDNSFTFTNGSAGGYLNTFDGNWGCRYVVRFNTIRNGRVEYHSLQGDNQRGCRAWEVYNNTWTNSADPSFRQWLLRAGTGVVFHESSDGGALNDEIIIDNDRSHEGSIANTTQVPGATGTNNQVPTFGMCGWNGTAQANGNSFIDGNTAGQYGWPCRDQIGRSSDASLWSASFSNPAPAQSSQPSYFWKNTDPGGEIPVTLNCENNGIPCSHQSTNHIVEGRDYYTYRSSFTGAAGVGEGTLASRPSTCTTGVAYWATDQGDWRTDNGATKDGRLDVCTATNTWTDGYYVPYTYPHPLQASGGGGGGSGPGKGKMKMRGKDHALALFGISVLALRLRRRMP